MPKQKITKELVMNAAFHILREKGVEQVLVKTIAAELSCSVQPIYSYCSNMDALRQELAQMSGNAMRDYVENRISRSNDDIFQSTGKAYISFAKEEPHLFKGYFLKKRHDIYNLETLYAAEASENIALTIAKTLCISESSAKKLHLNMIIFTTGLSFMLISTGSNFSEQELCDKLDEAYRSFLLAAQNTEKFDKEVNI